MSAKIAVVGCGYWGKNLIRNFAELGYLAAVVDQNLAQAQSFAQQFKVPALDFNSALADPNITAIAIAVPAELHFTVAAQALKAGKDVFVEKPLALNLNDAQQLQQLAQQHQRVLMVGHLLQYHPAFIKLKTMCQNGDLGRLQYIYSSRLNLGKFRREENIWWSFAPHDISMILELAGELPHSVQAHGANYLHDVIADVTTTHMSFASGVKAQIFVSWLHPFKEQKLVVIGSEGMAVFDDGQNWEQKLQLYPHKIAWIDGIPQADKNKAVDIDLTAAEPLKEECQHFINCCVDRQQPRTDAAEGIRVLQVLQQAEISMQQKAEAQAPATSTPTAAKTDYMAHPSAYVDQPSIIGKGTKIWHFSHILPDSKVGSDCIIGQNVMLGPEVTIGDNCKIQNNVSIYKGVTLEDEVFCGPSCVFTNVNTPRANIDRKDSFLPTLVKRGATIGANATIVCGHSIGEYSFIAAGSVVTKDVKAHALMAGVPAKQIGWVSHAGEVLPENLQCPRTKISYFVNESGELETTTTKNYQQST